MANSHLLFSFVSIDVLGNFVGTYLLHSTILLALAWLFLKLPKLKSHFVAEQIWKMAAVAGFVTAAIQLATGLGNSIGFSVPEKTVASEEELPPPIAQSDSSTNKSDLASSLALLRQSLDEFGNRIPADVTESKTLPDVSLAAVVGNVDATPLETPNSRSSKEEVAIATIDFETEVEADEHEADLVAETTTSNSTDTNNIPSHTTWSDLIGMMAIGWFAVSGFVLAWQSLRFRWQVRGVKNASDSHLKLLAAIIKTRGITRRVRFLKSDRFQEPVAFGLFRWTILLPLEAEHRLNRDELSALLSHELAHLRRGDIVRLSVGRVLTTGFVFQPLNFLARRRCQLHAEFQCDDWAISREVDRVTLARSLTLVAEWRAGYVTCAGVVSASGQRFHITDRVERLLEEIAPDNWKCCSRRIALYGIALSLALLTVIFGPQTGIAQQPNDSKSSIKKRELPTSQDADALAETKL